jgi:hypothetical protein
MAEPIPHGGKWKRTVFESMTNDFFVCPVAVKGPAIGVWRILLAGLIRLRRRRTICPRHMGNHKADELQIWMPPAALNN